MNKNGKMAGPKEKHAQLMVLRSVRGRLSQQAKQKRPGQSKIRKTGQKPSHTRAGTLKASSLRDRTPAEWAEWVSKTTAQPSSEDDSQQQEGSHTVRSRVSQRGEAIRRFSQAAEHCPRVFTLKRRWQCLKELLCSFACWQPNPSCMQGPKFAKSGEGGPQPSGFTVLLLTSKCASRHNCVHLFAIAASKSGRNMRFFCVLTSSKCGSCHYRILPCTFSTSALPKMLRTWCALHILTSKYASRHNRVHTTACTFWTSQLPEVLRPWGVFNVLTSKSACNFWFHICPMAPHPEPQNIGKHSFSQLFYLFALFDLPSSDSFSSLIFFLLPFSSLALPTSAFPSVHIVGSLTSKLPSIMLGIQYVGFASWIYSSFVIGIFWIIGPERSWHISSKVWFMQCWPVPPWICQNAWSDTLLLNSCGWSWTFTHEKRSFKSKENWKCQGCGSAVGSSTSCQCPLYAKGRASAE